MMEINVTHDWKLIPPNDILTFIVGCDVPLSWLQMCLSWVVHGYLLLITHCLILTEKATIYFIDKNSNAKLMVE